MSKSFSWVFLAVSGAFFVFVVGLTGYRIDDARRHNAATARERLPSIAEMAVSQRDAAGGYAAPQFGREMRSFFDSDPRLLLLSIHSEDGLLYFVGRNRSLLREPAGPSPQWRGSPTYAVNRGYEMLLSAQLPAAGAATGTSSGSAAGAPGGTAAGAPAGTATLDVVSIILGREDLYPVVRDDLYIFLAFLLVCGVVMLIMFSFQQEQVPGRAPAAGAQAARPGVVPPEPARPEPAGPAVSGSEAARPEERQPGASRSEPSRPSATAETARTLTSPSTGFSWAEHLETRLHAELERAAAADQDIACARVRIDGRLFGAALRAVYAGIAQMLRAAFPSTDLLFEAGDDSYTVVLPDTGVDAAVRLFDELRARISSSDIEGARRTISVGVSSRGGRLIERETLLEEADTALSKAVREGGNQVIGFRADAARFRQLLAEPVG
jgi:diguanylate cyclase (GGDEF)-like protein